MTQQNTSLRQLILAALFAALLAVAGQFSIPVGPAPITLQTLIVLLSGLLLGPRYGPLSIIVFIALAGIGLPILSGGSGGVGTLFGPTGGFIFSWPIASFAIGMLVRWVAKRGEVKFWHLIGVNLLGGSIIIFGIGVPWLLISTGLPFTMNSLTKTWFIFIPGDLAKVLLSALIAISLYRVDRRFHPAEKK
ncbi:biotin transport system substrate-specific component [Seinonella peptonophila]|uniref:Biotin transporter n=1 Tax=Seinonella peptonophila TaxID=112248 RepID=A0A1M4VPN9_9BACL|nr:biotin transporter BioY [Seinonella peptonophila]SHE70835.1 biotin transport system substrate-specific component [Seinonella peptonophila]